MDDYQGRFFFAQLQIQLLIVPLVDYLHVLQAKVELLPPDLVIASVIEMLEVSSFLFQEVLCDDQVGAAVLLLTQVSLMVEPSVKACHT